MANSCRSYSSDQAVQILWSAEILAELVQMGLEAVGVKGPPPSASKIETAPLYVSRFVIHTRQMNGAAHTYYIPYMEKQYGTGISDIRHYCLYGIVRLSEIGTGREPNFRLMGCHTGPGEYR